MNKGRLVICVVLAVLIGVSAYIFACGKGQPSRREELPTSRGLTDAEVSRCADSWNERLTHETGPSGDAGTIPNKILQNQGAIPEVRLRIVTEPGPFGPVGTCVLSIQRSEKDVVAQHPGKGWERVDLQPAAAFGGATNAMMRVSDNRVTLGPVRD